MYASVKDLQLRLGVVYADLYAESFEAEVPDDTVPESDLAAAAAEIDGTLRCGIYRFGQKWMVSPFESDDAEACNLFRRAHAERFPDMWLYRAR